MWSYRASLHFSIRPRISPCHSVVLRFHETCHSRKCLCIYLSLITMSQCNGTHLHHISHFDSSSHLNRCRYILQSRKFHKNLSFLYWCCLHPAVIQDMVRSNLSSRLSRKICYFYNTILSFLSRLFIQGSQCRLLLRLDLLLKSHWTTLLFSHLNSLLL